MSAAAAPSWPSAICAEQVARLAGMTNVISALLSAIPILAPETQMDALQTCTSMAADVACELEDLTWGEK